MRAALTRIGITTEITEPERLLKLYELLNTERPEHLRETTERDSFRLGA
jgi:hypothetical protein